MSFRQQVLKKRGRIKNLQYDQKKDDGALGDERRDDEEEKEKKTGNRKTVKCKIYVVYQFKISPILNTENHALPCFA